MTQTISTTTFNPHKWLEDVQKCRYLPQHQMFQLCELLCRQLFKSSPLVSLQAPITVCGDIHGQFYDLQNLIRTAGDPKDNKYVFLGDYVDRGYYSLETLTYLFLILACYPQNVTLLRGNHETRRVSLQYGFYEECQIKYGHSAVWSACCKVFDLLPIAALINDRVFCVHGGLSPELRRLDALKYMDRNVEVNTHGVLCDLLWSDPDETDYGWAVNARGAGYRFGADIAIEFMQDNALDLICRSHQLVMEGFKYMFGERLATVWSAPNYCYRCGNVASVLKLNSDLNREVVYFDAIPNTVETIPDRVVTPYFLLPFPFMQWSDFADPLVVSRRISSRLGPGKRSGHRVFVTDDYLYSVGGYSALNARDGSSTFRDIWRLNLLTSEWTPGFPFGESVSNTLYECTLLFEDTVQIRRLEINGIEAPRTYGQSTTFGYNKDNQLVVYVIGGTQGHLYSMTIHDGGCNSVVYCPFETLTVFDLATRRFSELTTNPDTKNGYPIQRKGHALVKLDQTITIFGGLHREIEEDEEPEDEILDDVWHFDLRSFRWHKSAHSLPSGVFFHSGDVTTRGQIFSYGGCKSSNPANITRTKKVFSFFVRVPRLDFICSRVLINRSPQRYVGKPGVVMSVPFNVIRQTLLTAHEHTREDARFVETAGT
ncbi:Serine/threonine-protein phosphatase [Aphelenchoides besseyi]|nr:Serine/threonine-protein phosphatase [Aphelenchoides besseyi]